MNTNHRDINKIVPYGDNLNGLLNQKYITQSEINRILRERGIFAFNTEKDYTVPLMQNLLLSPVEFDKIREVLNTKEDNKKISSSRINFKSNITLFAPELMSVDIQDYIQKQMPTCKLKNTISFKPQASNNNHLIAEFTIERNDINKMWYGERNEFVGSVEVINDNGNGRIIITHTAPETREIGAQIAQKQIQKFKTNNIISETEIMKKILFSDFTNSERFRFFYKLTNNLSSTYFSCEDIKDVSIKPEDGELLDEIKWMQDIRKMTLNGSSIDKKFFMYEEKYHNNIILWAIQAKFNYDYNNEKGQIVVNMGFPDYLSKNGNAEFELNIISITPDKPMDLKTKKKLSDKLRFQMDELKLTEYNSFFNE